MAARMTADDLVGMMRQIRSSVTEAANLQNTHLNNTLQIQQTDNPENLDIEVLCRGLSSRIATNSRRMNDGRKYLEFALEKLETDRAQYGAELVKTEKQLKRRTMADADLRTRTDAVLERIKTAEVDLKSSYESRTEFDNLENKLHEMQTTMDETEKFYREALKSRADFRFVTAALGIELAPYEGDKHLSSSSSLLTDEDTHTMAVDTPDKIASTDDTLHGMVKKSDGTCAVIAVKDVESKSSAAVADEIWDTVARLHGMNTAD